jgi:hypothetical protein
MWAKKWLLGRDRFTHLKLLNFRHGSRHGSSLVTKLALSVFVAVWIRESGLGPPTNVRANSKPAARRAPPKALTSQARIGQVRLVTIHTQTSLTHWNPNPAGLASQTRTFMGTLKEPRCFNSDSHIGRTADCAGVHIVCQCSALACERYRTLGLTFLKTKDLENRGVTDRIRLIPGSHYQAWCNTVTLFENSEEMQWSTTDLRVFRYHS